MDAWISTQLSFDSLPLPSFQFPSPFPLFYFPGSFGLNLKNGSMFCLLKKHMDGGRAEVQCSPNKRTSVTPKM
ncbi:hypothetical protein Pmani_039066 [Petrolisthes manimaculis]|uniref:Uncharacterized protein n=1 Tax=Petrolisthes manimaculis TaxID=1843537 RepID=A0AAE1NEG2_9EUCA|nr:hypothetical protein Pmani_039066 [Petrolisthes manimaculis]